MGISEADFTFLSELLRQESAIVLEKGKEYLVETRLSGIVRSAGMTGLDQLVAGLRNNKSTALVKQIVDAMTTNETSFFRDLGPFEALRHEILPKLIASRASSRRINIWSAAASTGQELFTIAMTIREHFPDLSTWTIDILGTDLSRTVLEKARKGVFSQLEVNRGLPAPLLIKYFQRSGNEWAIKEELRKMIRFEELNLIKPWPLVNSCDIIFIRNVLIYFDLETKKQIFAKIRKVLKPDGYLFLGAAETTMSIDEGWERKSFKGGSYYVIKG